MIRTGTLQVDDEGRERKKGMGHVQQGVDNGRVGASSAQVVNEDAQTVTRRRGPQLLKRAGKLYDICEVPARDFLAFKHHFAGHALSRLLVLGFHGGHTAKAS